jgi:serine/threonine-protein kinase
MGHEQPGWRDAFVRTIPANAVSPSDAPSVPPRASVPVPKGRTLGYSEIRVADESSRASFAIGELVEGTYEIRAVLGEGGMGQVFEAEDVLLRRRVAIKIAARADSVFALRREAQALAAIRHPCVVGIHAIRRHRDIEYLVMERVFGISLEQHLERSRLAKQPFTIDETLDVLIAIADGLAAVHRAGIAHRDIKPANVMLAPGNRVVLMDFGLFQAGVEARDGGARSISGSPAYMAPESIRDNVARHAAHLVDLYALGVVAFELLTGQPPFEDDTIGEIFEAHLSKPAPWLRDARADVPEALSRLVARLLAKNPHDRPESAEGALAELREIRARGVEHGVPRPSKSAFSVLIADDDPLVRDVLEVLVRTAAPDAVIRTAESGALAIESARERPPNVLVLDLQMPDINGVEVCMYLRGTPLVERCKIVLVSADADARDVALLRQLGVTHYLPKSESLHEDLVELVRELRSAAP